MRVPEPGPKHGVSSLGGQVVCLRRGLCGAAAVRGGAAAAVKRRLRDDTAPSSELRVLAGLRSAGVVPVGPLRNQSDQPPAALAAAGAVSGRACDEQRAVAHAAQGDPDVFGEEMRLVAAQLSQPAAGSAVKSASKQTPKAPPSVSATMPTFWMTISSIVHHKLQSEQKKQMMTAQKVEQYNNIVDTHSGLLQPSGPAYQLDMTRLTSGCGPGCTEDGIHYNNRTFDVALQQTLNALQHLLPKTPRFQFHNNITGVEVNHSEISTVKKEVVF
eukprot:CAMPEP_0114235028 /NCGR_PEP_ID=MMETSP0058-20121206/6023_1 /TAXON_ID=36894 /ORGANISM="Pyramimonas parkeae, CCMP726" /LENGTH=271 /DNA_ID=CAMNT_0001346745 /DNA_START=448 /DNA_END=1264 /DNA_ORIENTATION=+